MAAYWSTQDLGGFETTAYNVHGFSGSGILRRHSGDSLSLPHNIWGQAERLKVWGLEPFQGLLNHMSGGWYWLLAECLSGTAGQHTSTGPLHVSRSPHNVVAGFQGWVSWEREWVSQVEALLFLVTQPWKSLLLCSVGYDDYKDPPTFHREQ